MQPPGLKNAANTKCQKLHFLDWPLDAGSKSESILIETHIKNAQNVANLVEKMVLFSLANFVIHDCAEVNIYVTHVLKIKLLLKCMYN